MSEEILEQQDNNLEELTQEVPEVEEVVQEEVKQEVADQPKQVQSEREENIKALRESRKKLQQEKEALERQLKEAQEVKNKYEDDDYEDDQTKEIKQIKQYIAQNELTNQRLRLQTQYPDFNKVVTEDSIAILKERFPEVAQTLDAGKDVYSTGVSAYNIIKKFGLHVDDEQVAQQDKIQKNMAKPMPSSAVKSQSPLTKVGDYSDLDSKEVRDEILRQSMEYTKNL